MGDIRQILEMEKENNRQIRLYRIDMYWLAFERSAFNLFSVCNVDNIVKIKDMKEERNRFWLSSLSTESTRSKKQQKLQKPLVSTYTK